MTKAKDSSSSDEMNQSPRPALINIIITNQGKKSNSKSVKSPANAEIVSLEEADKSQRIHLSNRVTLFTFIRLKVLRRDVIQRVHLLR